MADTPKPPLKAYQNERFLNSRDARPLRILSEYFEPKSRFDRHEVNDTVVFMGSARTLSREDAEAALAEAEGSGRESRPPNRPWACPSTTKPRANSPIA